MKRDEATSNERSGSRASMMRAYFVQRRPEKCSGAPVSDHAMCAMRAICARGCRLNVASSLSSPVVSARSKRQSVHAMRHCVAMRGRSAACCSLFELTFLSVHTNSICLRLTCRPTSGLAQSAHGCKWRGVPAVDPAARLAVGVCIGASNGADSAATGNAAEKMEEPNELEWT